MKQIVGYTLAVLAINPIGLISLVVGLVSGYSNECTFDRIINYYPPYVIGCELTKPRWKK